ncbi:hypothetical protein FNH04_18900 [Streptomyces phyllanthi]|uniref:Uncharacterized protein n=1 Tax=Streptomyces phyllanthi TaxID=1803180 RepID=A0A5N8W6F6_9ACTN|nr:hypothetical protein [Streptomyces phyllanthi]
MGTQKPQGYSLTEPSAEPAAAPGCATCLSLSVARQNARCSDDYSAVSDCNVQLRQHQNEAH